MLWGVLQLALATAVIVAVIGVLLYLPDLGRRAADLRRQSRECSAPPAPAGPPVERIASDLRRLRALTRHPAPGEPMARRRGALAAYDEALLDACRALGLPDTLSQLPPGPEREAERLRVEYLLGQAGIAWHEAA